MGLSVERVSHTYGAGTGFAVHALRAVTLRIEPGSLTLVVGGTGSGKSTLMRVCAGLLEPTEGAVSVDGAPVLGTGARRGIGLVFQNPEGQFFAESVLADVAFGPRNLGMSDPRAAAMAALEAVGLSAERFAERSPFSLSGGEARRVAIAGVLAMAPAYVLLDEPTAGLDARGRAAVMRVVGELRPRAGVLVVTHDADDFLGDADRVIALGDGEVRYDGTPAELLADPERFESAGFRLPELVRAQLLAARRAGAAPGDLTLDAASAATRVLAMRRRTS